MNFGEICEGAMIPRQNYSVHYSATCESFSVPSIVTRDLVKGIQLPANSHCANFQTVRRSDATLIPDSQVKISRIV